MKIVILLLSLFFQAPESHLEVNGLIGNHMVIQRDRAFTIEGKALPNTVVRCILKGKIVGTVSNDKGEWKVRLTGHSAGGPFDMEIQSKEESISYSDIQFGDVWLASGQSNMAYRMGTGVLNWEREIKNANYEKIRMITLDANPSDVPLKTTLKGKWKVCSPQTVSQFSAVAYYFAERLHKAVGVPIGIVVSAWGGSSVEAWMSKEVLKGLPARPAIEIPEVRSGKFTLAEFSAINSKVIARNFDIGQNAYSGLKEGVAKWGYDDERWETTELLNWSGENNRVYWFRKKLYLDKVPNDSLVLYLGKPGMFIDAYINGKHIGKSKLAVFQRKLTPQALKKGKNLITLRLGHPWRSPFLINEDSPVLKCTEGSLLFDLGKDWKYSDKLEAIPEKTYSVQHSPSALYNGMIHPILNSQLTGVIWYQGETEGNEGERYRALFPELINDWRIRFKQGYFPFLYVQLANFGVPTQLAETKNDWAFLREAQDMALTLPNTGMAVAIDIGEPYDIHPKDKKTVGERLALLALEQLYRKDVVANGPRFHEMTIKDDTVLLTFHHAERLYTKDGKAPQSFVIAGEDREFHKAVATIQNAQIYLSSTQVTKPKYVRYAWARNPIVNLYNAAGLPAVPFRTDDFKPTKN